MLSIFSTSAWSDDIELLLKKQGFMEAQVPQADSKEQNLANHSPSYFVSIHNESLAINQIQRPHKEHIIVDAGMVKYIGVDKGEWGGGLYLDQYDPEAKPFFYGNIQALIPIKDDLYIISGLAHFVFSSGAIHVIRDYKKPSQPQLLTLLPDAPSAVLLTQSGKNSLKIVLAGHFSLMEFYPDKELRILAYNTFWETLYPTSIVEWNNNYYIGIRSGVAVVKPLFHSSTIRYFIPKTEIRSPSN